MKDLIKKKQYQMSLLYGIILFLMGIVGMLFPASLKFIANFCFIFGGSSLITGLLYLSTHKKHKSHEKSVD